MSKLISQFQSWRIITCQLSSWQNMQTLTFSPTKKTRSTNHHLTIRQPKNTKLRVMFAITNLFMDQETPECFRGPWHFTFSQKRPVKPPEQMVLKLPQGVDAINAAKWNNGMVGSFKGRNHWKSGDKFCLTWWAGHTPNIILWRKANEMFASCLHIRVDPFWATVLPRFPWSQRKSQRIIFTTIPPRNAWKHTLRVRKETIHTWYRNSFSIPPFLSMAVGSMVAFQTCFQSELTQQISRPLPFKCLPSIFRTPCHTWCTSNRDSSGFVLPDFLPNVHPFFSIEKKPSFVQW